MGFFVRCLIAAPALLASGLFVACSSSNGGFDETSGPVFTPDGGSVEAAPGQSCEGRRCSRDLHEVHDGCTDDVLEVCPADQACAEGACVSACTSASKAQGSIGCDFWTTPPDVQRSDETSCYAAFVANTWSTPATVTAEFGSAPLDISKSIYRAISGQDGTVSYQAIEGAIPPGELGIVFLSQGDQTPSNDGHIACPSGVNVAYRGTAVAAHATSLYKAFHLVTDVPVSAYSMFPYGGAKSMIPAATVLLPVPSWDTNYLLIDGAPAGSAGNPFVQIIAQQDGTEIHMRPTVDLADGDGLPGSAKGTLVSWTLNKGQVLELSQAESLAGTPIETSHPVALFGGNQCTFVPAQGYACDALDQQIAPVHEWSTRYSAVPYPSRRPTLSGAAPVAESVAWRIVGASEETTLTYDPAPPYGAPLALSAGQIVDFNADQPFVVKSQDANHPIYLAVYMSSGDTYFTLGDPDFVNVVADDQFLDHYVFFVDHTYSESNLTVVRRKDQSGFHDVTLDCFGPVTGWQSLGGDDSIEYAWVNVTHGHAPAPTPIGTCNYGRHEASSEGAFALYVWGTDRYASYGFPAGTGARPTSPYQIVVH